MGVWDWFCDLIFSIIIWFYSWCGDWGLAIILITLCFRVLIYPITRKQFKSTYAMQKLTPKINAVKEKYPDDKVRQNEEMQRIYQEAKYNPLSGCLPMLLQMPLFMALYGVLGDLRRRVAEAYLAPEHDITMFGQSLTDILNNFNPGGVLDDPSSIVWQDGKVVSDSVSLHEGVMTFFGLVPDLAAKPSEVFSLSPEGLIAVIPYIVLVALFGVSMLIPLLTNKDQNNQSRMMMIIMAVMMMWFGWGAPAGVLLYWDVSSLVGVAQQNISRAIYQKEDEAHAAEVVDITPVKVDVERKEKKARPRKKN